MRKKGVLLVGALILCTLLQGCTTNKAPRATSFGEKKEIITEEYATVVETIIEEDKIVVVLDLEFDTITLDNFFEIHVHRTEAGYDPVMCDKEETIVLNGEDVFSVSHDGEVSLVFQNDYFKETDAEETYRYMLTMVYDNGDGTCNTHWFLLGAYPKAN